MDCSAVIKELKIRPIRRLSHKENSTVFTASREDGTVFVLRVYDRETAAYKMLEGKDIPGLPRVYGCRFVHGFFVIEAENGDLLNVDAAGLNRMEYVMEKAVGFEPETKPLTFSRSTDGRRYEAFFPDACTLISDEGTGRFFTLDASVQ